MVGYDYLTSILTTTMGLSHAKHEPRVEDIKDSEVIVVPPAGRRRMKQLRAPLVPADLVRAADGAGGGGGVGGTTSGPVALSPKGGRYKKHQAPRPPLGPLKLGDNGVKTGFDQDFDNDIATIVFDSEGSDNEDFQDGVEYTSPVELLDATPPRGGGYGTPPSKPYSLFGGSHRFHDPEEGATDTREMFVPKILTADPVSDLTMELLVDHAVHPGGKRLREYPLEHKGLRPFTNPLHEDYRSQVMDPSERSLWQESEILRDTTQAGRKYGQNWASLRVAPPDEDKGKVDDVISGSRDGRTVLNASDSRSPVSVYANADWLKLNAEPDARAEAQRSQLLPERSQFLPERSQLLPERSQLLPERSQLLPERSQHLPERSQLLPERSQLLPERSHHMEYVNGSTAATRSYRLSRADSEYFIQRGLNTRSEIVLTEEFNPKKFLNKVPATDTAGRELPAWKRLLVARQLAELAQKEAEERRKREEEEARFLNMPPWKRALIQKKESEVKGLESIDPKTASAAEREVITDEDGLPVTTWQRQVRTKQAA